MMHFINNTLIFESPGFTGSGTVTPPLIKNMEVHHHPDLHHKRKKFREYFLEFLMIFLAVTMGFFAESYREYSVEKARAGEYARSLVHDLEKDTAMVRIDTLQMGIISSKIDSLAAFLKGKGIRDLDNRQVFAYTHFDCQYRPYTWSRATLDEIKGSGSLRYFSNDSIIMKISAYDALTKHLDQDFNGDEERKDRVSEKRNRIVDLNYGLEDSIVFWRMSPDSIMRMVMTKELREKRPALHLLTRDMNDIKSLLNDYLEIQDQFKGRGRVELPHLIREAAQLITLLKKEYHFKDD
jgi:hypothetical protein